jgi:hypothetical protein
VRTACKGVSAGKIEVQFACSGPKFLVFYIGIMTKFKAVIVGVSLAGRTKIS